MNIIAKRLFDLAHRWSDDFKFDKNRLSPSLLEFLTLYLRDKEYHWKELTNLFENDDSKTLRKIVKELVELYFRCEDVQAFIMATAICGKLDHFIEHKVLTYPMVMIDHIYGMDIDQERIWNENRDDEDEDEDEDEFKIAREFVIRNADGEIDIERTTDNFENALKAYLDERPDLVWK